MVLKNISEEIKRIEVELGELNSTTFEHSMKRIKHKTGTQAHQTVRKSDSGITSEGQTKFRFKRREKKNKCMTLNIRRISVKRHYQEKDEGGYQNSDTSSKKPSNYKKASDI